jgi:hypothetical protein
VTDGATGKPVSGATIRLAQERLATTSKRDGSFAFARPVPTRDPYRRLEATVTAPGWGRWTITGVPLYPNDTLVLSVRLSLSPFVDRVQDPAERAVGGAAAWSSLSVAGNTCSGWDYQLVPPAEIWVYRHLTDVSQRYAFEYYVRHVLPNEWIPSWDADALGAGAVAARTYAAYRAMSGHAYSSGAGCADVRDDTADQIFDPSWTTAATDAAVEATFGSIMYRDGGLFLSQYWAGAKGDRCARVTGQYAGRMSQWGTQTCATQGMLWPDIVETFYDPMVWNYENNLLLNPSIDSAAMYPWVPVGNTSIGRVQGGAYAGGWYATVKATVAGANGIAREERPYEGTPTTTYHARAALRCPKTDAGSCTISMKVVADPASGPAVTSTKTIVEPNDGVWRLYLFDPPASGIAHDEVWLSFVSVRRFNLDAALLSSPFGGP